METMVREPGTLRDDELVACVLGVKIEKAAALVEAGFVSEPAMAMPSMTWKQAQRWQAASELVRRHDARRNEQPQLQGPREVSDNLSYLLDQRKEHFVALYMTARNRLIKRETVSIGTLTASLVHPREVFGPALMLAAAGVIVAHNHPSGDSRPSVEDRAATARLERAGKLLGVPLLDHVIVSSAGYFSFREEGGLKND